NRKMHGFNDWFYINVGFPVARGYRWVVPEGGRLAIKRFFHNILFPVRFVNNIFQFKILNAGEETLRFSVNTTVGLLGFFDPAKSWFGLESHDEDFGQTLGHYGVGGGVPIVLPFLGHTNLRDTISLYPDYQLDPLHGGSYPNQALNQGTTIYSPDTYQELGVTIFEYVNEYSFRVEEYEAFRKDAIDFYLFMRDGTEQARNQEIKE
ncbi:MAG: ABC transporter, partial [Deltaproteobacteria bacterium]|nr:ABC transporter [Deltaproteobacteria bacterium]